MSEQSEMSQDLYAGGDPMTFYVLAMSSISKRLADGAPVEMSGVAQLVQTVSELSRFYSSSGLPTLSEATTPTDCIKP
jgi:hypothetical protein